MDKNKKWCRRSSVEKGGGFLFTFFLRTYESAVWLSWFWDEIILMSINFSCMMLLLILSQRLWLKTFGEKYSRKVYMSSLRVWRWIYKYQLGYAHFWLILLDENVKEIWDIDFLHFVITAYSESRLFSRINCIMVSFILLFTYYCSGIMQDTCFMKSLYMWLSLKGKRTEKHNYSFSMHSVQQQNWWGTLVPSFLVDILLFTTQDREWCINLLVWGLDGGPIAWCIQPGSLFNDPSFPWLVPTYIYFYFKRTVTFWFYV